MNKLLSRFSLGALLLWAVACGDDSPSSSQPRLCVPGQQILCACLGANPNGIQVCNAQGSGFGACQCVDGPGAGGQAGAGQAGSAGSGVAGTGTAGSGQAGSGVAGTGQAGAGQAGSASGGAGKGGSACGADPSVDSDEDGWTPAEGDCNDCNPSVNPGAVEVLNYAVNSDGSLGDLLPPDQQIDEDCDGENTPLASCDAGLGAVVGDPFDAAKAIGLCSVKVTEESRKWGVIDATFSDIAAAGLGGQIKATGKALEHAFGILPDFGKTSGVREGERLFAISSGIARAPGQPGWGEKDACNYDKGYLSSNPPGFPKEGSCGSTGEPHDGVALDLKIRVPTNAKSFSFKFRFFSCEYPVYACQTFNDAFAVLMSPSPLPAGDPMNDPGNSLGNIAFELLPSGKKNVIGVNNQGFFTACEPGPAGYVNCKKGNGAQLEGSGFEGHGASSWLSTQVPAPAGQVMYLRFAIWDSSDGILDSTAILDGFTWSTKEASLSTDPGAPDLE